jgi:hypothetical protein
VLIWILETNPKFPFVKVLNFIFNLNCNLTLKISFALNSNYLDSKSILQPKFQRPFLAAQYEFSILAQTHPRSQLFLCSACSDLMAQKQAAQLRPTSPTRCLSIGALALCACYA